MLRKFSLLPAALVVLGLVGVAAELAAAQGTVNLNTASAQQLALLPRVGETVAQRIIAFREANGPFKAVEELMLVEGIGERTFEQMRPHVALSGETTLAEKV
ncbi:MAG: ComEA family DNA-binding protein, partial [Thermoanaerobaculia bacterium]